MSDRKPEDKPITRQMKRRRINEEEQQKIMMDEVILNQHDKTKILEDQIMDLKVQLQEMANENTKSKTDLQTMKKEHNKEMAAIVKSHKTEMTEINEKMKQLEEKIAKYEMPPQIFKLDVDCVQEIFDYLSIKDIHSVSKTCYRMERIAGDYFETNLKALHFQYDDGEFKGYFVKKELYGFKEFVQELTIDASVNDDGYRTIGLNCKSLKEIHFRGTVLNPIKIEHIKPILSKIETLAFTDCVVEGEFYESFLKCCPNLKQLYLNDLGTITSNSLIGTNNKWLLRSYPLPLNLHLISMMGSYIPELPNFFKRNPTLHTFSFADETFMLNIDAMMRAKIQLQVLYIEIVFWEIGTICSNLNALYNQGFYQQLHLRVGTDQRTIDNISSLHGLESLDLESGQNDDFSRLNLNSLTNLKKLSLDDGKEQFPNDLIDLTSTAKSLVNLERLYIGGIQSEMLEAFIQYSVKLKVIKFRPLRGEEFIDLSAWNKKRQKLVGARKVTIYLGEEAYLATKCGNKSTDLEMIELKRVESSNDW